MCFNYHFSGAPIACLGAGTGLGEVYLTNNGKNYDVWPSEGGHADFSPRNELEFNLMNFMRERERVERVSVERVVSGLGLPRIYEFLCERSPQLVLSHPYPCRPALTMFWCLLPC